MHMFQFVVLSCFTALYVLIVLILVARLYRNLTKSRSEGLDNSVEDQDQHISIERPVEGTDRRSITKGGASRRPASPDFRRVRYDTAEDPQAS